MVWPEPSWLGWGWQAVASRAGQDAAATAHSLDCSTRGVVVLCGHIITYIF